MTDKTTPMYLGQDFVHFGEYGENGFVEDYTSTVRGERIANIAVVYKNPAGQTQYLG
ncbi:hypothetical protein ACFWVC_09270 [Streptomyces sp. NPDC058691]|uniref:hypothetical protein n=1 Tax=Streptomyces sp. NPDC058691 TaxID=3346601 RepID=UPI003647E266